MSVGVAVPCFECGRALSHQEFMVRLKVLGVYRIVSQTRQLNAEVRLAC